MKEETAYKAIDDIIASRPKEEPLNILFMGGEPFLAFAFMDAVVSYVSKQYSNKVVRFKAVSNGTLIHGHIQQWLIDNKDVFEVTLSLDGDRETHNHNRCNSYDNIDFDFFINQYERHTTVSSVVVPDTLNKLAENVIEMERKGFGIKYALADGITWDIEKNVPILEQQLDILIDYYLQHPQQSPMSLLSYAIWCIPGRIKPQRCIPGVWTHCVNPDGKIYACHRSTPYYNCGQWPIPKEKIRLNSIGYLKEDCAKCCVRSICNACPATVASIQHDANQVASSCSLNKVIFVANAKLAIRMFLECPEHIHLTCRTAAMQADMLEGAQIILNQLQ